MSDNQNKELKLLLPFHLLIDENLNIISFGISMEKLFPKMKSGDELFNTWIIELVNKPNKSLTKIEDFLDKEVLLTKNSKLGLQFKGEFKKHNNSDNFIFIGNVWFDKSINSEYVSGFNIKQDPLSITNILELVKERDKEKSPIDLKDLIQKINRHKKIEKELEKALIATKETAASKEAFISNMSHEMRTPLNGIIGMIRELNKQKLTIEQQSYVDNAYKASKHLLSIINNVLDLSKIKAGELKLSTNHFDFKEELNNVSTILQGQAAAKEINFLCTISPECSNIYIGDPTRIRQILINLLGNSIKFTDKGFVSINIENTKSYSASEDLLITISDSGKGMDQNYLKNIFTKFQQEDASSSRKHSGTGLGMAITKELIDLMKGSIKIESSKNIGTNIFIKINLPLGDPSKIKESTNKIVSKGLEDTHILLVEDNEINRYVAYNALKNHVKSISEAENGREAIELIKGNKYDLILMDLQMPEMSGLEATHLIREDLKLNIPIVALTANAFKSEIEKCIHAGMNNYIAKPFNEKQLITIIQKEINNVKKESAYQSNKISKSKLYNLDNLHEMSRGDKNFVSNMIQLFIKNIPISIETIETAIRNKDITTINKIAHKIKPSLLNLGISSIYEDVKTLEKYTLDENDTFKNINVIFSKVKTTLEIIIESLSKIV
jgi:signal transduction histidine kinase/CheY-like chemotaxis protein/HPt (histidine-containing phosphotransfer) domain-containing protein